MFKRFTIWRRKLFSRVFAFVISHSIIWNNLKMIEYKDNPIYFSAVFLRIQNDKLLAPCIILYAPVLYLVLLTHVSGRIHMSGNIKRWRWENNYLSHDAYLFASLYRNDCILVRVYERFPWKIHFNLACHIYQRNAELDIM